MTFDDDIYGILSAHREILDLYIEQLFGHNKGIVTTGIDPCSFATGAPDAYKLWLMYARLGIPVVKKGLRLQGCRITEPTDAHKKCLKDASQGDIDAYVDWVFPEDCAQSLKKKFGGTDRKFLVSPVHFWFFMSRHVISPDRPLYPKTLDTLFRHPLFFIESHTDHHHPLVVPEYFFDCDASFEGLTDFCSTPYYIFPFFGKKLFEYVTTPHSQANPAFATYYFSCELPWFIPMDSVCTSKFIGPHPTVRRHWRWEEVLEMLCSQKELTGGPHPNWWRPAPPGYVNDARINAYLNHFAKMAKVWARRQAGPNA